MIISPVLRALSHVRGGPHICSRLSVPLISARRLKRWIVGIRRCENSAWNCGERRERRRCYQERVLKKTGAYPKISSRCASVGAAVLLRFQLPLVRRPDSGPVALMVGGFPRIGLRVLASVPNPQLVQSPDDLRPSDPFRLAPSLLGLSPIIDQEIIFLFLRKTNCSS